MAHRNDESCWVDLVTYYEIHNTIYCIFIIGMTRMRFCIVYRFTNGEGNHWPQRWSKLQRERIAVLSSLNGHLDRNELAENLSIGRPDFPMRVYPVVICTPLRGPVFALLNKQLVGSPCTYDGKDTSVVMHVLHK